LQPLPEVLPQDVSGNEVKSENSPKQGEIGIHWLRGTIHETEKAWLIKAVCLLFGNLYEPKEYGYWKFYDRHYKWPCGASIQFHSTGAGSDTTNGRIALEVPGSALELLDSWCIGMLCCNLSRHGFQPTRCDYFYDDRKRIVTPSQLRRMVYQLGDDGKPVVEDFMHFRVISDTGKGKKGVGLLRDEVTFGNRGSYGSGKLLRIYDKEKESEGQNDAIRYELELCDHKVKTAFDMIVNAFGPDSDVDKMLSVIGQIIGGSIDFRMRTDRVGDKNLNRLERYPFWQAIIDGIGSAKLAGKKIVQTIEKAKNWVGKGVGGTLQMLSKALGLDECLGFIVEICTSEDRLRPHHEKVIADYLFQESQGRTKYSWQKKGFAV